MFRIRFAMEFLTKMSRHIITSFPVYHKCKKMILWWRKNNINFLFMLVPLIITIITTSTNRSVGFQSRAVIGHSCCQWWKSRRTLFPLCHKHVCSTERAPCVCWVWQVYPDYHGDRSEKLVDISIGSCRILCACCRRTTHLRSLANVGAWNFSDFCPLCDFFLEADLFYIGKQNWRGKMNSLSFDDPSLDGLDPTLSLHDQSDIDTALLSDIDGKESKHWLVTRLSRLL